MRKAVEVGGVGPCNTSQPPDAGARRTEIAGCQRQPAARHPKPVGQGAGGLRLRGRSPAVDADDSALERFRREHYLLVHGSRTTRQRQGGPHARPKEAEGKPLSPAARDARGESGWTVRLPVHLNSRRTPPNLGVRGRPPSIPQIGVAGCPGGCASPRTGSRAAGF